MTVSATSPEARRGYMTKPPLNKKAIPPRIPFIIDSSHYVHLRLRLDAEAYLRAQNEGLIAFRISRMCATSKMGLILILQIPSDKFWRENSTRPV